MSRIPNTGNYHNEILVPVPGWHYNALLNNLYFIIQSRGFYVLFRNVKPAFQKLGLYGGLAYTGLFYILARGKEPWTFKHGVSPLTIGLCFGSGSGSIESDQKNSSFQKCIFVRNGHKLINRHFKLLDQECRGSGSVGSVFRMFLGQG